MAECYIIDACVLTSASPKTEISRRVADFLEIFLQTENEIGMTEDLKKEWFDHQSTFTAKFYSRLYNKRRIIEIPDHETVENLRLKIHSIKDKQRVMATLKDMHLLEAAILKDKFIISLDDKARNNFNHFYNCIPGISDVCWLNPSNKKEEPIKWLLSIEKYDPSRFIINYSEVGV
ncbi:hypothetical protein C6345_18460 [Bacillus sp. LNXM12-2]|uniref:hypothetical protein n=1 Tax=Bacillus TaxID=1386 RepID=UPI0003639179|nr:MULTISPECIES: hypothetical protein [Bacillus]PRO43094.1 hypothetical protein C6W18_04420 [Bacillus sp. LLTC93]PSB71920.1 hypothetical protein C6Y07_06185 [Bacillus sp. LNXM12-1]PSB72261.1 hypothetical protein C6345_18460 [Bacillus sp. LNXM12-2]QKL22550.1 hypothetical protein RI02_12900 [Bacillus altitudinis]QKL26283.1 hypothetical protein EQK04_12900 [Bacillus altitudinis]